MALQDEIEKMVAAQSKKVDASKQAAGELKRFKDVEMVREGTRIILPRNMKLLEGAEWLVAKAKEEEQQIRIYEEIDAYPLEGAYALQRAIEEKYGFVSLQATPGFFGDTPPTMVGIEVDVGRTVQVPWGRIQIPSIDGFLMTGITQKEGKFIFTLNGEVKRKDEREVNALANLVREFCRTGSIYKGKAIQVAFTDDDGDALEFDITGGPKFMDVSGVRESELIYSDDVRRQVEINLFTPVEKTGICLENKVPLKRGVLLEGPYGTGKTLCAMVCAKKCVDHGWTYIYLKSVRDLPQAIQFAKQYEPAMIFAEDIDRVVKGERSTAMDKILNTIDGVDSKNSKIISVLTTNHVELIHRAMLRPGRFDAVIGIRPPDAGAVQGLVQLYGRNLVAEGEDLTEVGERLAGQIPAVIREVMERAKLAAISRLGVDERLVLTSDDLLASADGMLSHLRLLEEPEKKTTSPMEDFADRIGSQIVRAVNAAVQGGSLTTAEARIPTNKVA